MWPIQNAYQVQHDFGHKQKVGYVSEAENGGSAVPPTTNMPPNTVTMPPKA